MVTLPSDCDSLVCHLSFKISNCPLAPEHRPTPPTGPRHPKKTLTHTNSKQSRCCNHHSEARWSPILVAIRKQRSCVCQKRGGDTDCARGTTRVAFTLRPAELKQRKLTGQDAHRTLCRGAVPTWAECPFAPKATEGPQGSRFLHSPAKSVPFWHLPREADPKGSYPLLPSFPSQSLLAFAAHSFGLC